MAWLKDRSLPHSCEGSHQPVPWKDLFTLNVLFSDQAMQEFTFCLPINYTRECTGTRASSQRKGLEWGWKRRVRLQRDTRRTRENVDQASTSYLGKPILRKRKTVLQSKGSIDKIQWFVWNLIPSTFHWNGTMECGKVYELFTVVYLPSLARVWVSNTLREWGTVRPGAQLLGTFWNQGGGP